MSDRLMTEGEAEDSEAFWDKVHRSVPIADAPERTTLPPGWAEYLLAFIDGWDGEAEDEAAFRQIVAGLAALEQELGETMVRANRYQARTLDLRAAIREWEEKRRYHAGYVVYDEDLDELRALTKPEGE